MKELKRKQEKRDGKRKRVDEVEKEKKGIVEKEKKETDEVEVEKEETDEVEVENYNKLVEKIFLLQNIILKKDMKIRSLEMDLKLSKSMDKLREIREEELNKKLKMLESLY